MQSLRCCFQKNNNEGCFLVSIALELYNLSKIIKPSQMDQDFFLNSDSFIIAYHISLVKVQTNYCNNNLLIVDVKQVNKIMKLYYFYALKALWDNQGKIRMYYGMSRIKKQLSGKSYIAIYLRIHGICNSWDYVTMTCDVRLFKV